MISLKNICCSYGKKRIINNLNIEFSLGEIICLVGPNGCGKTTLLKSIANIIPKKGEILIDNTPINNLKPKEYAKKVAYLPQINNPPSVLVNDLVKYGRFPYLGVTRRLTKEDFYFYNKAVKMTNIEHLLYRNITTLSGGEKQKVYLAMIIAQNSDIMLLDEPITYLDIRHQLEVLDIIKSLKKENKTIITVIHDLREALDFADSICLMENGNIVASSSPKEIINNKLIEDVFKINIKQIENSIYFYKR